MTTITLNDVLVSAKSALGYGVREASSRFTNVIAGILHDARAHQAAAAEVSAQRLVFVEAEALRAYAALYAGTDQSFAQDLFAAADRHKRDAAQ